MNRNLFRTCTTITALALLAACGDSNTLAGPKGAPTPGGPDFGLITPANGPGACMGDDGQAAQDLASAGTGKFANWISGNLGTPPGYNCTANDVSVAKATITKYSTTGFGGSYTTLAAGDTIQCSVGQTVFIETTADVKATASQRWDIGIWIADPVEGSAMNGSCKHYNLIPVGAPGGANTRDQDGDACGDIGSAAGTIQVPLDTLQVVCPGGQPRVTVNNCIAWSNSDLIDVRGTCPAPKIPNQNGGTPLSEANGFRYGTVPENGAKCNCTPFEVPIDVRGKITIIKNTVGGDGLFGFTSDVGANSTPNVGSTFNIQTASNTGTQLIDLVKAGTYHIAESTPPSDFDFTSLSCTDNNTFVTHSVSGQTATIVMGNGGDVTCTFTNTKRPSLTLVKVVTNDDGGTKTLSDFPLTAQKTGTTITGTSGTTAVTGRIVPAGTYALSEQTQAGYTASSWVCTGGTQSGTNIALASGGATCTITNDDVGASLTLVKVVTNNSGGTKTLSDFPLTATGTAKTITGVSGSTAVTGASVPAGSYALSEQTQAGYDASAWDCSGGTQSGTNIALGLGGSATCTITNDDKPAHLTLVKQVTNDDGGTKTVSDFPLTAQKTGTTINGVSGTTAVTGREVPAGSYALSEQTQAGYTASSWVCSGGTQTGTNIALGLDGSATCTITNDDNAASLTLVKVVTNNSGGTLTTSDFPLTATGTAKTITGVSGSTAVTGRGVPAGSYALSEQTQAGYDASAWVCSGGTQSGTNIALGLGGAATCTITNDDKPAHLTLVKVVTNDNGGTRTLSDFPLTAQKTGTTITGVSGTTAVSNRTVPAGSYALSEQTRADYTASSWVCSGGTQTGTNIALGLDGSATCTITNDDKPASLTIIKHLKGAAQSFGYTTTGGGGLDATFTLSPATDGDAQKAYTNVLSAGTYTITEDANSYLLTDLNCSDQPAGTYDPKVTRTVSVTLALGESKTCEFTNEQPMTGGTTRTQGFWATHMSITNAVWFGGTIGGVTYPPVADQMLCGRSIDTIGKLLGGFWSNIANTSKGKKRSDLDQARMQLLQQLLAAELNNAAFGSTPSGMTIAAAEAAYCGTDVTAIKNAQSAMASFNTSGDNGVFTPGASANGKVAKTAATLTFWDVLP